MGKFGIILQLEVNAKLRGLSHNLGISGSGVGGFMSSVSPVFHTTVIVRIGLKTQLEWEHPFHNIICLCWSAERSFVLIYLDR